MSDNELLGESVMSSSLYYPEQASSEGDRFGISRRDLLVLGALGLAVGVPRSAAAEPQGQLTWGVHVSLAPTWFDPAETPGVITPFMIMYALPPCCMDRRCGRTEPDPCSRLYDADVLRAPQLQHSVQHVGGDGDLARLSPIGLAA